MVEDALRGVLKQALKITEAQGLPGAHHFYITFDTTHPGLKIAPSLKALHPNEMTIVLQHQFWDLNVGDERFEITLSFSGVSQRLSVPFAAVTAFADPHAKFGLQFHVEFEERSEEEDDDAGDPPLEDETPSDAPQVDSIQVTQALKNARKNGAGRPPLKSVEPADGEDADAAANKVVTLDAFRKK
ncbi:MAG: hypothetical protein IT566_11490 [Rhodospirillaceae bacterium]|nr:hypothetical protein [Rhodospirillaceae bacterium]